MTTKRPMSRPFHLVEWRKFMEMKAIELAEALDIERESYHRLERNWWTISVGEIDILASALAIRPEQLWTAPPSGVRNDEQTPRPAKERMVDEAMHKSRQPRRPHFIPEWAERRALSQAKLAVALGADKSVVSRWYAGASPSEEWQEKLADLFNCERDGIFRHPDHDWIVRFFHNRSLDEVDRMKQVLEVAFPTKGPT
jgi:DNA-binding XRE family transcriptional regulator/DNA-binding transcriptional regulator YiaG